MVTGTTRECRCGATYTVGCVREPGDWLCPDCRRWTDEPSEIESTSTVSAAAILDVFEVAWGRERKPHPLHLEWLRANAAWMRGVAGQQGDHPDALPVPILPLAAYLEDMANALERAMECSTNAGSEDGG